MKLTTEMLESSINKADDEGFSSLVIKRILELASQQIASTADEIEVPVTFKISANTNPADAGILCIKVCLCDNYGGCICGCL